jgi:signal peptidase I
MDLVKIKKILKEAQSIVLIILAVLVFRSTFYEPFRIPSGSMIPTLLIGDFILVNKFSYGFKVPFSDFTLTDKINFNPIYLFGKKNPERGDVVVFKFPSDPSTNFIKRVVGLPGDILEVKNKTVYINEKPVELSEINGKEISNDMDDKFKGYKFKFFKEKIGTKEHVLQLDQDNYYKLDYSKITIPPGKFFMMGDNRDYSYDSRGWGLVSEELIKGKAMFVWFSFILPFGDNPIKFRPWRIFQDIN